MALASTAVLQLIVNFSGPQVGGNLWSFQKSNSTSPGPLLTPTTFSSGVAAASTGFNVPPHARWLLLVPQHTSAPASSQGYYIAGSTVPTSAQAIRLPSTGIALIPVFSTFAVSGVNPTKVVFWSTNAVFANSSHQLLVGYL